MSKHSQTSEFHLEGQFLGFAAEDGYKLKLLRLSTPSGVYDIKMPKELRSLLYRTLKPGQRVQVSGYQKSNPLKGTLKLKAEQITPLAAEPLQSVLPTGAMPLQSSVNQGVERLGDRSARTKPETILVCQKSDCCKRGARAVTRALEAELESRGLTDQVAIRGTGCMKQCKAGPNVVMPGKSRYSRIHPEEVAAIVDRHFPETAEMAS